MGALQSRDVKKAEYTTSLPKAPEGEYVVVEYASAFSNLEDAVETVVMTKTEEDDWATVGYFIRPAAQ